MEKGEKMTKTRKLSCLLLCFSLLIVSVFGLALTNRKASASNGLTTVNYSVGTNGVYVTDNFDNAVSYVSKSDATTIPNSDTTYGKTLHEMLSIKLSEGIDISKTGRVWDGFLINVKFTHSFRFYMWLGDSATDGSVVISRNYNSRTDRYEKFLDVQGNDLSASSQGVLTKSGYCTSTGALSGTWVYNFSDIIVMPNQTIDEILFGLRMDTRDYFGKGFEINSISVYKGTGSETEVKTLFNASDLSASFDANDATADINLADHTKGKIVNNARGLANNTSAFIDHTTYASQIAIGKANVSLSIPNGTVTVNYIDESGEPLKDSTSTTYRKGASYTVVAPTIPEYAFKESDVALTGTVNGDITVNLTYAIAGVTVTVNYIDGNGNPISEPTSRSYYAGSSYKVDTPFYLGYEFVSADKPLTGTISSDIVVNVTYSAVEVYKLTVKYVDEQNVKLEEDDYFDYNSSATYTITVPEIEHYVYKTADKPLTGTISDDTVVTVTYKMDPENPIRTLTDVNYASSTDGVRITDSIKGGIILNTKQEYETVADSASTYGKTILATIRINLSEKIDATSDEWDGLMIRIKNLSAKNVKFSSFLLSNGVLSRNFFSATVRDEVFIDNDGVNQGVNGVGVKFSSGYPTISAGADGTWNYKFSDILVNKSDMTAVESFIIGLRICNTEFADCGIVIGSIAAYKADGNNYTVKTLFNSKDLVITDNANSIKADVNLANPDNGKIVNSTLSCINNAGLFVADEYYSTLHPVAKNALNFGVQGFTLTCNYVDQSGDVIEIANAYNINLDGAYQVTPVDIVGYEFVFADKALSGTLTDDATITLTYKLIEFTLTVKFVNESGETIREDLVKTIKYGDWIVIDAEKNVEFKVEGYKFKSIDDSAKFTAYEDVVRTITYEVAPGEKGGCSGSVNSNLGLIAIVCILSLGAFIVIRKSKKQN